MYTAASPFPWLMGVSVLAGLYMSTVSKRQAHPWMVYRWHWWSLDVKQADDVLAQTSFLTLWEERSPPKNKHAGVYANSAIFFLSESSTTSAAQYFSHQQASKICWYIRTNSLILLCPVINCLVVSFRGHVLIAKFKTVIVHKFWVLGLASTTRYRSLKCLA